MLLRPARPLLRQARLRVWLAGLAMLAVAQSAAAVSEKSSKFYEDAIKRAQANDIAGATVQLKNAIKLDRTNLGAHLMLGRILFEAGELKAAEAALEEAMRQGVGKAEVAPLLGQVYLKLGNTRALLDSITPSGLPPAIQAEVLTLRGAATAMTGNLAQAGKLFADARTLDPRSPLPDIAESSLLLRNGGGDNAVAMARRATELAPNHAGAWHQYGSVLYNVNKPAEALPAFDKALALNAKHVDARVSRASILYGQRKVAEASAELKILKDGKAIEPRASFLRAVIAEEAGQLALARAEYTDAANLIDAMTPAIRNANEPLLMAGALSHRALGNREKVREYLDNLLARNPRHAAGTMMLAETLLQSNELTRAGPMIEGLLRANPEDPQTLYMMGSLMLARKQYAQAAEFLDKAARKGAAPALRDLSFSQFGQGQDKLALANLEKAFTGPNRDVRAGMELAVFHARQGDPKRAVKIAEELVARDPENLALINFMGNVKGRLRDMKGLKEAYERVLAKDPKFKPVVMNMSWFDMEEGRLDVARNRLRGYLKDQQRDADVIYQLGVLESMASRRAEAASLWSQGDAIQPKDPRFQLALMEMALQDQQPDKAVAAARTLQARHPESAQALMAASRAYLANGDVALARQTLQESVRKSGFDAEPLLAAARMLGQTGALDEAGHAVAKALQAVPDDPAALALRVELAARGGQPAEVDKALAALRAKHPNLHITLVTAGHVAYSRGQAAQAAALYRQVFDREPTTQLAMNLAQAHATAREPDKGVAVLEAWVKRMPRDLVAMRALADMQIFAGKTDAARQTYATLVQAQPNDAGVLAAQARLLARLNDPAALAAAERAFKLAPAQGAIADTYGWLLLRSGNTEGAVRVLREARLRDPSNAVLRWHLAAALNKAGKRGEATEELKAALASTPPPPADPELDRLRKELAL